MRPSVFGEQIAELMASHGSIMYSLTWKTKTTPWGGGFCQLAARERPSTTAVILGGQLHRSEQQTRDHHKTKTKDVGYAGANGSMADSMHAKRRRNMSIERMDATGRTMDGRKHAASLEHAVKFSLLGPNNGTGRMDNDAPEYASQRTVRPSSPGIESNGSCSDGKSKADSTRHFPAG